MTTEDESRLAQIAAHYGVERTYYTIEGQLQHAAPEAVLAVLHALGAPVETARDLPAACTAILNGACTELEYVRVLWGEAPVPFVLPDSERAELWLESGERWQSGPLPHGYHRLVRDTTTGPLETLLLCAPPSAHRPAPGTKAWGLFAPLFALHSARSWGAGDYSDWQTLIEWAATHGATFVGTLPLLPTPFTPPATPSPYAPHSRLFWNEFYIDLTRIPELIECPRARELLQTPAIRETLAQLRGAPLVEYHRIMALKQEVLQQLAAQFFSAPSARHDTFVRFAGAHPELRSYADFRAGEAPEAWAYHQYVQWIAHEQLTAVHATARAHDVALYLDFPLGTHPDGYDVWRYRHLFANAMSVGAPPDAFFPGGQNWGFPPLLPHALRRDHYRYWRTCVRHHMQLAGLLRIDHVMSLHRLLWIPNGAAAGDGVYVRYPAEELYAVLCLESRRAGTIVVGEDLGLVSDEVRPMMAERGILRCAIAQCDNASGATDWASIPAAALASLNTHDLPPFAAWWGEHPNPETAMWRGLEHLLTSDAPYVQVSLDDLWLETAPINRPGTTDEYPNWRRRLRDSLETMRTDAALAAAMSRIDTARKGAA